MLIKIRLHLKDKMDMVRHRDNLPKWPAQFACGLEAPLQAAKGKAYQGKRMILLTEGAIAPRPKWRSTPPEASKTRQRAEGNTLDIDSVIIYDPGAR